MKGVEVSPMTTRVPTPKPTPRSSQSSRGYALDPHGPLHRFFCRRMQRNRDVKIIITAKGSSTGTGKSTLAFWLAHQWNPLFTGGEQWEAETHATLDANDFMDKYRQLPKGSCLIMDEAEQLDARRSQQSENVDFSHDWMMMRVRQICSILTLPTLTALDSRLEELADVWINVERRGQATVHGISVNSYGNRDVRTPKEHQIEWPDVSLHPEMKELDRMKQEKLNQKMEQATDEQQDPDQAVREEKIAAAQRIRDLGGTVEQAASAVNMSIGWVSTHTTAAEADDVNESELVFA